MAEFLDSVYFQIYIVTYMKRDRSREIMRNQGTGRVRQNLMAHLACTGKPLDLPGKESSCSLLGNRVVQHQANILLQYF